MFSTEQARAALDGTVYTTNGEKIGKVGQIYLDDETNEPEWVTVSTGLFGSKESFVPLADARLEGDRVVVPYDKDKIKDAPQVDADAGQISQDEEQTLYSYYGKAYSESRSDSGLPAGGVGTTSDVTSTTGVTSTGRDRGDRDGDGVFDDVEGRTVGRDTSGVTTDEAMTRSEERLNVGTARQEVGRARLRKFIVTEQQTVTVPVSHEEVRVVTEPITDANVTKATDGPALSEEEHEVTLHAERAVVDKETVPVERVRLDTETVTSNETVTEDVSKERIEQVGDDSIDLRGERSTTERNV